MWRITNSTALKRRSKSSLAACAAKLDRHINLPDTVDALATCWKHICRCDVGKEKLHVAGLVGAAMCSAC